MQRCSQLAREAAGQGDQRVNAGLLAGLVHDHGRHMQAEPGVHDFPGAEVGHNGNGAMALADCVVEKVFVMNLPDKLQAVFWRHAPDFGELHHDLSGMDDVAGSRFPKPGFVFVGITQLKVALHHAHGAAAGQLRGQPAQTSAQLPEEAQWQAAEKAQQRQVDMVLGAKRAGICVGWGSRHAVKKPS